MLVVDVRRLGRERRYPLEGALPAEDAIWEEQDARPEGALTVALDVQDAAGDILVQGTIRGELALSCRRCLEPVTVAIDEPVALLYRRGAEPDDDEVYPLPERTHQVDLAPALREHWLLAAPAYAVCREGCKGLCPHCGQNLNEGACDCTGEETDSRWGPLLRMKEE